MTTRVRPRYVNVSRMKRGTRIRHQVEFDENDPRDCGSYWLATRRPLPSLIFVAPLMLTYEWAVSRQLGNGQTVLRTGADAWLRQTMASWGMTDQWLLPLGLVVILLAWQVVQSGPWQFRPSICVGMVIESFLLALALVGISRLVDLGFCTLERYPSPFLSTSSPMSHSPLAPVIGYFGAGIYEEALFRLLLVPVLFRSLRLLQTPLILSSALAATGSALLFSLAHHAGAPGEAFTWFAFVFRWMAGVFFAWVFVLRGFGVAVGTHTAYDVLVGYVGWPA